MQPKLNRNLVVDATTQLEAKQLQVPSAYNLQMRVACHRVLGRMAARLGGCWGALQGRALDLMHRGCHCACVGMFIDVSVCVGMHLLYQSMLARLMNRLHVFDARSSMNVIMRALVCCL